MEVIEEVGFASFDGEGMSVLAPFFAEIGSCAEGADLFLEMEEYFAGCNRVEEGTTGTAFGPFEIEGTDAGRLDVDHPASEERRVWQEMNLVLLLPKKKSADETRCLLKEEEGIPLRFFVRAVSLKLIIAKAGH